MIDDSLTESTYKVFHGKFINTLWKILLEGRTPLGLNEIIHKQVEMECSSDGEAKKNWQDNNYSSIDAVIEYPLSVYGSKIKIIKSTELFKVGVFELKPNMNGRSGLQFHMDGGKKTNIKISDNAYVLPSYIEELLQGEEFSSQEIARYCDLGPGNKQDIITNPIWLFFAGNDFSLLKEYINLVFSKSSKDFNMEIKLHKPYPEKTPVLRFWSLTGMCTGANVHCDYNSSRFNLLKDKKRFVGYMPNKNVVTL